MFSHPSEFQRRKYQKTHLWKRTTIKLKHILPTLDDFKIVLYIIKRFSISLNSNKFGQIQEKYTYTNKFKRREYDKNNELSCVQHVRGVESTWSTQIYLRVLHFPQYTCKESLLKVESNEADISSFSWEITVTKRAKFAEICVCPNKLKEQIVWT